MFAVYVAVDRALVHLASDDKFDQFNCVIGHYVDSLRNKPDNSEFEVVALRQLRTAVAPVVVGVCYRIVGACDT